MLPTFDRFDATTQAFIVLDEKVDNLTETVQLLLNNEKLKESLKRDGWINNNLLGFKFPIWTRLDKSDCYDAHHKLNSKGLCEKTGRDPYWEGAVVTITVNEESCKRWDGCKDFNKLVHNAVKDKDVANSIIEDQLTTDIRNERILTQMDENISNGIYTGGEDLEELHCHKYGIHSHFEFVNEHVIQLALNKALNNKKFKRVWLLNSWEEFTIAFEPLESHELLVNDYIEEAVSMFRTIHKCQIPRMTLSEVYLGCILDDIIASQLFKHSDEQTKSKVLEAVRSARPDRVLERLSNSETFKFRSKKNVEEMYKALYI